MNKDDELSQLLQLIYDLCNSKAGMTLTDENKWYLDAESMIAKLFNHLATISYLSKGTHFNFSPKSPTQHFVDHSSMSVIIRVAIETYLTFYYLFVDECQKEEKEFRYHMWTLGGLYNRQQYVKLSEDTTRKQVDESIDVRNLMEKISRNSMFIKLSKGLQKKALKGEWKLEKKWPNLAEIAGFDISVFKTLYNYLSSYSHTDSLCILQIKQAVDVNDQKKLTEMTKNVSLVILSHLIISFGMIFPDSISKIESGSVGNLVHKHHISFAELIR